MFRAIALAAALFVASAAHAQALDGRLKKIADSKTIAIAYRHDAMPFSFTDDAKQITGYSIDLCKRVVDSIERQLNIQGLQIKWVPVTTQSRFDVVAKGGADMECGSSTMTLTRLKQVDFSSVIFVETTGLLVKTASGLRSIADMSGKRIAVIAGTTNEQAVQKQIKRRQLIVNVVIFKTRDEALAALEDGRVDAFASDKLLLIGAARKAKDRGALTLLSDDLSFEPYAITLPHGDAAFRLAVNTGLARLYESGQVLEIYQRWFAEFGRPSAIVVAAFMLGAIPE